MRVFLAKSHNKRWATMLELMAMMTILALWVWGMLGVIWSGTGFAKDTEDTIKAINLAREWIEGITNLRNTNWLRFSSDKTNCWKVQDYVSSCIGNTSWASDIASGSYVLYTRNGAWYLSGMAPINPTTDWATYRESYKAWLDNEGFYTQTGVTIPSVYCSSIWQPNCMTPFNREIQITPIWTGTIQVKSIVRWQWKRQRDIILLTTLTNWKSKF